jgi:hypothetical protein
MRLNALQHMRLAKHIRLRAPKLPKLKRARALKLAGLGEALARAQSANPGLAPKPLKARAEPPEPPQGCC